MGNYKLLTAILPMVSLVNIVRILFHWYSSSFQKYFLLVVVYVFMSQMFSSGECTDQCACAIPHQQLSNHVTRQIDKLEFLHNGLVFIILTKISH